jgi:hypothetical protein
MIRIIKIFFIFRYNLKPNDAILATDKQKGLNESLLRDYPNHQFVAGGAAENAMRAATVNIPIRASNRSNFALTKIRMTAVFYSARERRSYLPSGRENTE